METRVKCSTSKLLRAEDEQRLARQIAAGVAASLRIEADDERPGDRRLVRDGRRARRRFIEANVGLVYSMARKFGRPRHVSIEDVAQDGMVGLHTAVDRFDPEAGFRFSTYATWWIRQSMQKGLESTAGPIRIPHAVRTASLRTECDKVSTLEGLARQATGVASIDAMTDSTRDTIADASADPGDTAIDAHLFEQLSVAVGHLDPTTRDQLIRWFGIDGNTPESLRTIGRAHGMTASAVRKRIAKGLAEMRRHCDIEEPLLAA